MNTKREFMLKIVLATCFMSSLLFSVLWMGGYLHGHNVLFSPDQQLMDQPHTIKKEIQKEEVQIQGEEKNDNQNEVQQIKSQSKSQPDHQALDSQTNAIVESKHVIKASSRPENKSAKGSLDIAYDLEELETKLKVNQFPVKEVTATGYTAGYESTGKHPDHPEYGITYSGVKVRRDLYSTIAADPNVFPLGTILYIPNYGYGVVADTGGAIKGNKIDLYFKDVEDVYQLWGKQSVKVYILQRGDGKVTEEMLNQLNTNEALVVFNSSYK